MKTTLLSTVIAVALATASVSVQAQADAQLPLSGAAYRIAEQAFAAYERGDYRAAYQQSTEAIRLRPDVVRLRLLQIYALQKLGRGAEAQQQARRALDAGLKDPALPALAAATAARSAATGGEGARTTSPSRPVGSAADRSRQQAYALATEAYAAYDAGRMGEAASKAEQAFRQQPKQSAWALLWVAALEAQQQPEQADAAIGTALQLGAPNVEELRARRVALGRQRALLQAQQAYQSLSAGEDAAAIEQAHAAVELAPDVASYRLLLITAQLQGDQLADAEHSADQALQVDANDLNARVMRGYLRQRQGSTLRANEDFDAALATPGSTAQQRNVRLLAVDAALAAGDRVRAAALLAPLQAPVPADERDARAQLLLQQGIEQRAKAIRSSRALPRISAEAYPAPVQHCQSGDTGNVCELMPADLQGDGGAAQRAYAAYARRDYADAIDEGRQAVQHAPDDANLQGLLTTTLAAGNRAQQDEARRRLDTALAQHPDDAGALMQRGYLNQKARDPAQALADFRAAEATGKAPKSVVLDQAYASAANGDHPQAVTLLRSAIDRADVGELPLDEHQRYNVRNAIANYSREWGVVASAGFRGARQAATNVGGAAISTPGDSVFSTLEAFWRPPAFNDQHGTLELYARLLNTLYDEGGTYESIRAVDPCTGESTPDARARAERLSHSRSTTGWPSTIASFGLRYAFGQTGLSAGIERRQFLGSATRQGEVYPASAAVQCRLQLALNRPLEASTLARYRLASGSGGWMSYLTYGYYHGTDLRTDVNQWWMVSGYAQGGYTWDDNGATFTLDALDANGTPVRRLGEANGRLHREQWFAAGELRAGRSFRFGAGQTHWVVTPYVVVGADWLDQRSRVRDIRYPPFPAQSFALNDTQRSWSLGAGPGVGVRYWFREDHYNTPRSYLDLTVQYRIAIGGGDTQRAKGLFATAILYY
ncbi:NfrA family protein [Stenotrophomonas sp. STK17_22]|uniref:NfrA family protein n=1 Tax=Stenotrophomonas sp. STK17_22 TaxID=3455201 RepID=UPI003F815B13